MNDDTSDQRRWPRTSGGFGILTRWLAEAREWLRGQQERGQQERGQGPQGGPPLWTLYQSDEFAHLWYAAREAGERLRAQALARLYTQRAQPGGAYPDPREPAAFSPQAILAAAANTLGLAVRLAPARSASAEEKEAVAEKEDESEAEATADNGTARKSPLAWLITFPASQGAAHGGLAPHVGPGALAFSQPQLWLHAATLHYPLALILFEAACLLGYVSRERALLLDPHAPRGVTLLPTDPGVTALMHQFAIALLCLDPICPAEWTCHCNTIRHRFTAPPADHEQPTGTIRMADLTRDLAHQQQQRPDQRPDQRDDR